MPGCKAPEILPNKAYLKGTSLREEEGNAADGRFSSAVVIKKTPGGGPGGSQKSLFSGDQPTLEEVRWLKKR
jgi:hypothetical protein